MLCSECSARLGGKARPHGCTSRSGEACPGQAETFLPPFGNTGVGVGTRNGEKVNPPKGLRQISLTKGTGRKRGLCLTTKS